MPKDTPDSDYCDGIEIRTSPEGVRYAYHPDHAVFVDAPTLELTRDPILLDDLRDAVRQP